MDEDTKYLGVAMLFLLGAAIGFYLAKAFL